MATIIDNGNGIITLAATSDEYAPSDSKVEIEGVLLAGTAAGASVLQDSSGNTLVSASLTTSVLAIYIPLHRRVNGLKASTLATNQKFYVYMKMC